MNRVDWWQSQLDWHELNRDADPEWHDSQAEYYRAAIVWGSPRACLDVPFINPIQVASRRLP